MLTVTFMLVGILLIVLQTTLLHLLPGGVGRPDLVFLLVSFAAYRFAWLPGLLLSFMAGWVLDVLVGINLGVYPLQCIFVFCCLKIITTNSPVKEAAYQIPLVGVSYFLMQILVYLISSLTLPGSLPKWDWTNMIQQTVLLVLAAIPCFLLFNGLYEYLQKRATRSKPARRRVAR